MCVPAGSTCSTINRIDIMIGENHTHMPHNILYRFGGITGSKGETDVMRMATITSAVMALGLLVSACATPDVVSIHKIGDEDLSCEQLREQFAEAQDFERKAHEEKGATGTNVAAAIFFWPALFATYSNIDEAVEAARDRQEQLKKIAEEKDCAI